MDVAVSDFFVKTCRVGQQLAANKFTVWCFNAADRSQTTTGSVSELYIEPVLSCIGDVDVMACYTDKIVLGPLDENRFSTDRVRYFDDIVEMYDAIPTGFPGYVYLVMRGSVKRGKRGKRRAVLYAVIESNRYGIRDYSCTGADEYLNGPAVKRTNPFTTTDLQRLTHDHVYCMHCPTWPTEAADWPTRPRRYGWPAAETIASVVKNGCDFVYTVHEQCKQNERDRKYQWRLSFSRAETVLLNTWTQIQQIVYHMLRVLVDTEGLNKLEDSHGYRPKILSRYHIKTLMMWTCELESSTWWTDFNAVQLCSKMLRSLLHCCRSMASMGYFITAANLFECNPDSVESRQLLQKIINTLDSLTDVTVLSNWFVSNYLSKCAKKFPEHVGLQQLFENAHTPTELCNFTDKVLQCRQQKLISGSYNYHVMAMLSCYSRVANSDIPTIFQVTNLRNLQQINRCLAEYFTGMLCLRLSAEVSDVTTFDEALLTIAQITKANSDGFDAYTMDRNSVDNLRMALNLMQQSSITQFGSTTNCIQLSLSDVYLRKTLDNSGKHVRCLVQVYLAVLHYTVSGWYQRENYLCMLTTQSNSNSCVVEGQLLPKTDDNINNVLGLTVFYQVIQKTALNRQQLPLVGIFSAGVIANYITRNESKPMRPRWSYICDVLLLCIAEHNRAPLTKLLPITFTNSQLRQFLVLSAVEHLTEFHKSLSRELNSECKIMTTDIKAMYDYRQGLYEQCLPVCQQNVDEFLPQPADASHMFVILSHYMTLLQDDDMTSMVGLMFIVSKFRTVRFVVKQVTLSLYMAVQCKVKMKHSANEVADDLRRMETLRRKEIDVQRDDAVLTFLYRKVRTIMRSNCKHSTIT